MTTFLFLTSWTLTHFLKAALGCLEGMPTFSRTMPLAIGAPSSGSYLSLSLSILTLNSLLAHLNLSLLFLSFLAAKSPFGPSGKALP